MRFGLLLILTVARALAGEVVFREPFQNQLQPGWKWIREEASAWRLRDGALEIRIQPGNMWGPENSGKNVLVRSLPNPENRQLVISMIVEHKPTHQYEQADLVCYFDDSHMVKIGEELVDGKLSIVMGREEDDKTRTIKIVPLEQTKVELRLQLRGNEVTGQFRPGATGDWKTAGTCDLPRKGEMKIAIQCYQGAPNLDHWARIQNFSIERAD